MERNPPSVERNRFTPGLEVIVGPMFSGKTDELMRRLRRSKVARLKVQLFKPSIDVRYGNDPKAHSHSGSSFDATLFDKSNPFEVIEKLDPEVNIVGIEEGQFVDKGLVKLCQILIQMGKRVIVAGLDMDFRGEPYAEMPTLLSMAEKKDSINAICMVCGDPEAHFTQRLKEVDGAKVPADYNDPTEIVGAAEQYEARCRLHHEVPGRPSPGRLASKKIDGK